MLSRNQIRIKIFHCLYSSYIKNEVENIEFKKSFDSYLELYYKVLELLIYIKDRAKFEINHGLHKKIATKSDLNPNRKFIKNIILEKIALDLKSNLENEGVKILSKKIFSQIKSECFFESYMKNKGNEIEEDKIIIKHIITEILFSSKLISDYFENESIYWNDDFLAVQILILNMISEYKITTKTSFNFKNVSTFKKREDEKFVKNLLLKTIQKKDSLTKIIHGLAKNWDSERIASSDLILMQLAIVEMTEFDSIPYKVSINEYIEISKTYSTKKSPEFINGILDAFLKKKILI